ncbi:MAG: hypothetical protein WA657_12350 [Candidatus Acidiferrales bacterium]
MDWKVYLDVTALLVGIAALIVSIYAILDARKKAQEAILLDRNRAYARARNKMAWLYLDSTNVGYPSDVAAAVEQFGIIAKAAGGKWSDKALKEAVENESLVFASLLVSRGVAAWKPEMSKFDIEQHLQNWQADKNRERIQTLLGRKPEDRIS